MSEIDAIRERQREHHAEIREVRTVANGNTLILARLVQRIEELEKDREERRGIIRTLRNALIAAIVAFVLGAAAVLDGIKGWFNGLAK